MLEDIIFPFITTEKGHRLGWILLILMGLLFCAAIVQTLFVWRADFVLSHNTPAVIQEAPTTDGDAQLIAGIPAQHLFGQQGEDTGFLPITSLQLQLTGIVKSAQNNLSRAIISEAGQPGKVYTVGDMVVSGIRIYAINQDGIVLEHEGRLEKLPLLRTQLAFKNSPPSLWEN